MRNAGRDPYLLGALRNGLEVIDCFARAGRPCAAVAVSARAVRLAPDDIAGVAAEVKATAGRISRMPGRPVMVSTGPRAA